MNSCLTYFLGGANLPQPVPSIIVPLPSTPKPAAPEAPAPDIEEPLLPGEHLPVHEPWRPVPLAFLLTH